MAREARARGWPCRSSCAWPKPSAAPAFLDITGAHIDSAIYLGEATLAFAERLASLGARVTVPTSLNVSGVDESATAPAAVITAQMDTFLTLASIVADEMYRRRVPIVVVTSDDFSALRTGQRLEVRTDGTVVITP